MDPNECTCGEILVTRDEITSAVCWRCSRMSERLSVLDLELAALLPPRPAYMPLSLAS